MEYLKYSFDTGKIEDGFSSSKSIKQYRSSYSLPDPEHESSYNLLTQWDSEEQPLHPPLFRKAIATKIIYFFWIQSEYNLSCMVSRHWELKVFPNDPKIAHGLWSHHFDPKVRNTHVIQLNGLSTPHSRFPSSTQSKHISTHYIIFIIHVSTRTHLISTTRGE